MNQYHLFIDECLVAAGTFLEMINLLPADATFHIGVGVKQQKNTYRFLINNRTAEAKIQKISKEERKTPLL